jgi:hypothetical protein
MIHTPVALRIAGVEVGPGTYSLYTVPGEKEWVIIVNRSTEQWGDEGSYEDVKNQEVGRGKAAATVLRDHVEKMTFRAESAGPQAVTLILEWEKTRVPVEIRLQ